MTGGSQRPARKIAAPPDYCSAEMIVPGHGSADCCLIMERLLQKTERHRLCSLGVRTAIIRVDQRTWILCPGRKAPPDQRIRWTGNFRDRRGSLPIQWLPPVPIRDLGHLRSGRYLSRGRYLGAVHMRLQRMTPLPGKPSSNINKLLFATAESFM